MRLLKLMATLTFAAGMCLSFALLPDNLCFRQGARYIFYCGDTSKNCNEVVADDFPSLTRLTLEKVCGESTEYAELDLNEFLQSVNGKVLFTEELSDSVNYYCSADLPYSVKLYGQTVNLHVCVKESGVKVASPIIFGGY